MPFIPECQTVQGFVILSWYPQKTGGMPALTISFIEGLGTHWGCQSHEFPKGASAFPTMKNVNDKKKKRFSSPEKRGLDADNK